MTSNIDRTPAPGDAALLPWSYRRPYAVRVLITIVSGFAAGVAGTLAHRMGAAENIPYGLLLALLLIGMSAWCARARSNAIGLGFHLIASGCAVWMMAGYGPGGDAMIPVGFSGTVPFFCEHAGVIWMLGAVVLQVVMLFLPARWFVVPPRSVPPASPGDGDGESRDDADRITSSDEGLR